MINRYALSSGVLIPALVAVVSAPLFVWTSELHAQSPVVVESRESSVTFQPPIEEETAPATDFSAGAEKQYQLQLLQQEIMQLRGIVEELQYQLQRQKSIQDDRYLELDARLQQALQATPAVESQNPAGTGQTPINTPPTEIEDGEVSEQALYQTTQDLIRNRQYDTAINQLEGLIARFPDGQYTANAYYWLGQVYAAKTSPDYEKARQALVQVITYFPDHNKAPDAAYALGKVYHTLGDCEQAAELLQSVVDQYPGKSAATLAATYLRESVSCES